MATAKEGEGGFVHECYYQCNSRKHASNLTAVITKHNLSDEKVAAYLKWCCVKYAQALDSTGRSLIHVAAAKGRLKLLMFLLNHPNVNINCKDDESNYTALHRSLFYGQIHCAVRLIQAGADIQQVDLDYLTPLDHVMKDKLNVVASNSEEWGEVYVWGTNACYNLGIGHNNLRANPEPLSFFRRENIAIQQAYMSKFHSLFIGKNGKVWVCGLGSGGTLGLGSETMTLVPKVIEIGNFQKRACIAASVGSNHTLLLLENGTVWSFGLNTYHQLGHGPGLDEFISPTQIKSLKGHKIVGVSASKFHSAFWTGNQLFTCGLHGGHLGHIKSNENTIPIPKLVTFLCSDYSTIEHVATSDGATVVATSTDDVYLFRDYRCTKIAYWKKFQIKKICVIGGHLNHKVYSRSLEENGGDELKILILDKNNQIYLWHDTYQQLTLCLLSLHRYINFTDIVLNKTSILLTTSDGEAFFGEIKIKKRKPLSETFYPNFMDEDNYNYIKMIRIPHIHRALSVSSDLKGRNFAIVQANPKIGGKEFPLIKTSDMKQNMKALFEDAKFDNFHDVVFEVSETSFPAHRYIVSHSSEILRDMINNVQANNNIHYVKIENIQPKVFERILYYLYTGECDFMKTGIYPVRFDSSSNTPQETPILEKAIHSEEISAFEYYKQQRSNKKKSGSKVTCKMNDPIETLKEAAKLLGISCLAKKLDSLYFSNGRVCSHTNDFELLPPQFNRMDLQNLWDISLKAEDGTIINAHKCILIARLDYFNCMINRGWLESSLKTPLNIAIPSNLLEIFIHYLYTDNIPKADYYDLDFYTQILIIADQFLCTRLREIAEVGLANMVSLKLATETLQLSVTYNADQLRKFAKEFICLNLSTLLEARSLEILDNSILTELTDYYRSWLPCMSRRNISTYSDEPDDDLVDKIYNSEPVSLEKIEEESLEFQPILKASIEKSEEKKSNESERIRNFQVRTVTSNEEINLLSKSFSESSDCKNTTDEEAWIMVTNHHSKFTKAPREKVQSKQRFCEVERVRNASTGSITSDEELLDSPYYKLSSCNNSEQENTWIMVTNHNSKAAKLQAKARPLTAEVISSKTPQAAEKAPTIPIQKSTPINVVRNPPLIKKDSFSDSEKEISLLSSSNKDFPALGASAPERTTVVSPKSPSESSKKFVKLSQKQRKKLAILSMNETENTPKKTSEPPKSAWGISPVETCSMDDIIKKEIKTSKLGPVATSPPWQASSSPTSSFSAIMAAERHERNLVLRMKSKSLEHTQMEDKAIDDLMLLYDISNVTDERITIRRADTVFISPPVWVSSHR